MSGAEVLALPVGARFEVKRHHGSFPWCLVEVTHVDLVTPGAGTLFESEPIRRLYVQRVTTDGTRGNSWEHDARDLVRLVEPGLFE